MAVFRVERNTGYTVMSNHHLRNKELSLKAKGLLSQMLSLPGLGLYPCGLIPYQPGEDRRNPRSGKGTRKSRIYRAQPGARRKGTLAGRGLRHIRAAAAARAGSSYQRRTAAYIGLPTLENPTLDNPTLEKPTQEKPTLENPTQLNKDISSKEQSITDLSSTHSFPFHSLNPLPFEQGEAATPPERKRTEAKSNSAVEIYRGDYQGQYRIRPSHSKLQN